VKSYSIANPEKNEVSFREILERREIRINPSAK
jgi:hypothetical protein